MNQWVCSICGSDTSNVDYDYLINYDHISCHLGVWGGKDVPTHKDTLKTGFMKINGWEKLSGFTYKGYTIVNPIHNAEETKYMATILNLNLPQKPKWELSVLTPTHKFLSGIDRNADTFFISMWDDNKFSTTREITKEKMKQISFFRVTFEELIDEMLSRRLTSAPKQTTTFNIAGNSGTYNNPNSISTTLTQSSIVDTIHELQKQIDELNAKLNTPTNPF